MATFGNTVQEPTPAYFDSWWAFQYNILEAGIITSITADFGSVGEVHIGVYADNGSDFPGALLVETGPWTPSAPGKQTKNVTRTPFSAGKIWIIVGCADPSATIMYDAVRNEALSGTRQFGGSYGAMPNPFPAGGGYNVADVSIYATYTTETEPPTEPPSTDFIISHCDSLDGSGDPISGSWMESGATLTLDTVDKVEGIASIVASVPAGTTPWSMTPAKLGNNYSLVGKEVVVFRLKTNHPEVPLGVYIVTAEGAGWTSYGLANFNLPNSDWNTAKFDFRTSPDGYPDFSMIRTVVIVANTFQATSPLPSDYYLKYDYITAETPTTPIPVAITISSTNNALTVGQTATLTAKVWGGTPPYNVEWKINGASVATGLTYTFTPSMPGMYTVTATATDSVGGTATSSSLPINVVKAFTPATPLHTEGALIKNSSGQVVLLRGVNGTSFLEDSTGNFGSFGTWNATEAENFIRNMAAQGFNLCRVLINMDWWLTNSRNSWNGTNTTDRGLVDCLTGFITMCVNYGVYIIIEPWQIVGPNLPNGGGASGQTPLPWGVSPINTPTDFVNWWSNVAQRLGAMPNVIFGLYNEPHGNENEWFTGVQPAIDAIRLISQNLIAVQLGYCGGFDWINRHPLTGGNILYQNHIYRGGGNTFWDGPPMIYISKTDIENYLLTNWSYNQVIGIHPVLIGEIGAKLSGQLNEEIWWENILSVLNDWGASYAAWHWGIGVGTYALRDSSGNLTWTGIDLVNAIAATVTLNVVAGTNGSVSPAGSQTLSIGQPYQFQAMPSPGYSFDHWDLSGTNKGSSNPLNLTATEDMNGQTLTAIFTANPVPQITLNIAVEGDGNTDLTAGSHTFNVGDTVSIAAIPQAGVTFIRWTLNSTIYIDNPLPLLITEEMDGQTLTAVFTTAPTPTPGPPDLAVAGAIVLGLVDAGLMAWALAAGSGLI